MTRALGLGSRFTHLAASAALVLAGGLFAAGTPAGANDSEAEWALGGLMLRANADIAMDSEELFLSENEVRVDYVYTNTAYQDREVTIAFPLPALPIDPQYTDYYAFPDWAQFGFATWVDGEKVSFTTEDRALIDGEDVTARVLAEGFPVHWYMDEAFVEGIETMPEKEQRRLITAGLLRRASPDYPRLIPAWQGQRFHMRTQTFPARQSVAVSHRYRPLVGGSVGGALEPGIRNDPDWNPLAEYEKRYCVDAPILAGIDKRLAKRSDDNPMYMTETWLGYVLSSGANWRGPIKQFRLVVDKGSPDNLVSFCMDGVKKISQTRFEVTKTDFEPKGDLDILILKFWRPEE